MVTPAQRRGAVAHLIAACQMSERRACRGAGVDRALVRYRLGRPDDAELRARLRALAHERRRFGYRRLHILLRREGWAVNSIAGGLPKSVDMRSLCRELCVIESSMDV
jgi:putative transposase